DFGLQRARGVEHRPRDVHQFRELLHLGRMLDERAHHPGMGHHRLTAQDDLFGGQWHASDSSFAYDQEKSIDYPGDSPSRVPSSPGRARCTNSEAPGSSPYSSIIPDQISRASERAAAVPSAASASARSSAAESIRSRSPAARSCPRISSRSCPLMS